MRHSRDTASPLVLAAAVPSARAEPLPTQHFLPLAVAIEAATATLDTCNKAGHHVSVEVMNHNAMVLVPFITSLPPSIRPIRPMPRPTRC